MKENKTTKVIVVLVILAFAFAQLTQLFEAPENPYREYIARQKFSGTIENKYEDTISKGFQILVNGKKHNVDKRFYNQLNIGDSVTKTLYKLKATIYKPNGKLIEYNFIRKKQPSQNSGDRFTTFSKK